MCPFDPPEDLNAQREAIVALWYREQALVAEVEDLKRKLAEADKKKGAGKGKKNKSERRGRTGHVPPPAKDGPPQKGHGPTEQPHLPEVERELDVDEGDRTCKLCGGQRRKASLAKRSWRCQLTEGRVPRSRQSPSVGGWAYCRRAA